MTQIRTTNRATTIKDVAMSAGVSIATVSNVLRGKDTLYTPETAQKVWHFVRSLEYRPNQIARSLVRQCTSTLGVAIDRQHGRLTRNAYLIEMLDGFMEFAVNVGYQIKIISLDTHIPERVIAQLEDGSVDGIALLAPPTGSPLLTWAKTSKLPLVLAGSVPPDTNLPCIDVDDEAVFHEATKWLIDQGHRNIGLISGPRDQWSARHREQGFSRAFTEADRPLVPGCIVEGDYGAPSGAEGMRTLLGRRQKLTAVMCGNDWMALGAMSVLQEKGIRIPEDIALIGFDNIEAVRWTSPPLTSIQQPVATIGNKAAEVLIRQIETGERDTSSTLFSGKLVHRQSTAESAILAQQ